MSMAKGVGGKGTEGVHKELKRKLTMELKEESWRQ